MENTCVEVLENNRFQLLPELNGQTFDINFCQM